VTGVRLSLVCVVISCKRCWKPVSSCILTEIYETRKEIALKCVIYLDVMCIRVGSRCSYLCDKGDRKVK